MKSVGTITYHDTINYGANLQTYALQEVIGKLGYSSEVINYSNKELGSLALTPFRHLRHFFWQNIVKNNPSSIKRRKRTEEFRRKFIKLSSKKYCDAETLHLDPPIYDFYITGSDQVWNPFINNNDSSYFLTFAAEHKTISYAASFGLSKIPEAFLQNYEKWLSKIKFLSTREVEGVRIIKSLTGRDAKITLDPTLLLDRNQWSEIAIPYENSKPYILCYYMPGDNVVNKCITKIAKNVSDRTGFQVICLGQKEYMGLIPWKKSIFDAGPAEYLGLFQNAAFIVTNSFHGTAFAINFQKPFFVPINQCLPPEKALTSRIITLLKTLKLEHRLLPAGQALWNQKVLEIDYPPALELLQKEVQRSMEFLRKSLER